MRLASYQVTIAAPIEVVWAHLTTAKGLVRGWVDGRRRLYHVDLQGLQRLRAELDSLWEPALLALKEAAEAEGRP